MFLSFKSITNPNHPFNHFIIIGSSFIKNNRFSRKLLIFFRLKINVFFIINNQSIFLSQIINNHIRNFWFLFSRTLYNYLINERRKTNSFSYLYFRFFFFFQTSLFYIKFRLPSIKNTSSNSSFFVLTITNPFRYFRSIIS